MQRTPGRLGLRNLYVTDYQAGPVTPSGWPSALCGGPDHKRLIVWDADDLGLAGTWDYANATRTLLTMLVYPTAATITKDVLFFAVPDGNGAPDTFYLFGRVSSNNFETCDPDSDTGYVRFGDLSLLVPQQWNSVAIDFQSNVNNSLTYIGLWLNGVRVGYESTATNQEGDAIVGPGRPFYIGACTDKEYEEIAVANVRSFPDTQDFRAIGEAHREIYE